MAAGSLTALHHSQSEVILLLLLMLRTYQVDAVNGTPLGSLSVTGHSMQPRVTQTLKRRGRSKRRTIWDTFDKSCTSTVVLV